MNISTYVNLAGIALSLSGFLVLVREVRYAHLTEYHSLNLTEAARKAEEFQRDPARFIKQSVIERYGERMVNLFGVVSDAEWQRWADENKQRYEAALSKAIKYAAEWKRRVPQAALKLRMRWLTTGAVLVVVGALLQATAVLIQAGK